tara:strand:+ start:520 stop:885 length:366 start_codon:yes stop_codon:yes gene_type:complete
MGRKSEITELKEAMLGELRGFRDAVQKENVVPFGMEEVSMRELSSRMKTMSRQELLGRTPRERESHLKNVGQEAFVEQVQKGMADMNREELQQLTPEQRAEHLRNVGTEAFIKQLEGGRSA